MAVSRVLTAFVVNQNLRIYHAHSASERTLHTERKTSAEASNVQHIRQEEEALV
jgi:hypothetical protein